MTQTNPRIRLPEWSPEEREARRQRALAALERNRVTREQMLARRDGVPVEVDDILDGLRGRTPEVD